MHKHHNKLHEKKAAVAGKMPYLGDASPRKGESLSKSAKRFGRYLKSAPHETFDTKGTFKSQRRQRKKIGLPF